MIAFAKIYFCLIMFTMLASNNIIAKKTWSGNGKYYNDDGDQYDEGDGYYEDSRGYAGPNNPNIVKGTDANIEDFPYLVLMTGIGSDGEGQENSKWGCTGVILTSTVILTSASCVTLGNYDITMDRTLKFKNAYIKAGVTNRNDSRATKIYFNKGIVHKNYSYEYNVFVKYNVALVKLNKPLCKSRTIQPLKFATEADFEKADKVGTVLGWGWTKGSGSPSNTLQQIQLKWVPDDKCAREDGRFMTDHMFCTKNLDDTYEGGVCYGDYGAPFIVNNKLYAIVAMWFTRCASRNFFFKVADYEVKYWIKATCWKLHNEHSKKNRPYRKQSNK